MLRHQRKDTAVRLLVPLQPSILLTIWSKSLIMHLSYASSQAGWLPAPPPYSPTFPKLKRWHVVVLCAPAPGSWSNHAAEQCKSALQ